MDPIKELTSFYAVYLKKVIKLRWLCRAFPMFQQIAGTLGCCIDGPQFSRDLTFPHQELKSSLNGKTRLIVVINPNNPTGSSVSLEQIEDLLKSFPDIPTLVDEAYFEFSGETSVPFLSSYPNLNVPLLFLVIIPESLVIDLDGVDIGESFKISSIKLDPEVSPTIQGRDFGYAFLTSLAILSIVLSS